MRSPARLIARSPSPMSLASNATRPLLNEHELEAVQWQSVTFENLMEPTGLPRALWDVLLKGVGPYPEPYSKTLKALCNKAARGRKPNVSHWCPTCGKGRLICVVGKEPGKTGIWRVWCEFYTKSDGPSGCEYFVILPQCGPSVGELHDIFLVRVDNMREACIEWLEAHNPTNTPLPQNDEDAIRWMSANDLMRDRGQPPSGSSGSHNYPVTPHKPRDWPFDDKSTDIDTPTPSPRKPKADRKTASSLTKPVLRLESFRDIFVNQGTAEVPSNSPIAGGSSSSSHAVDGPSSSTGGASCSASSVLRASSPGTVLVPGTPEPDSDNEVVVGSQNDKAGKNNPREAKRKLIAEVVIPKRRRVATVHQARVTANERSTPCSPFNRTHPMGQNFSAMGDPLPEVPTDAPVVAGVDAPAVADGTAVGDGPAEVNGLAAADGPAEATSSAAAGPAPGGAAGPGAPKVSKGKRKAATYNTNKERSSGESSGSESEEPDAALPHNLWPSPMWLRVVVWRRRRPATLWQPLWQRVYHGYDLEVASLLFDTQLLIYDRPHARWVPFNRDARFVYRGSGYSVLLRVASVEELWGFNGELVDRV